MPKTCFSFCSWQCRWCLAAVYGRRIWSFPGKVSWKVSVFPGGLAVLFYFAVTWLLPLWGTGRGVSLRMFHNVNGVKESAAQLGLGTAFARDVKWTVTGGGGLALVCRSLQSLPPTEGEARPNDGPGISETEEPPLDTSPNVLEIDF